MALVVIGMLMLASGLFAEAASASATVQPKLTPHRATFTIPANNPANRVWELSLWSLDGAKQHLLGKDTGTAGKLVVKVPAISGCDFQVDVTKSVTKSAKFYSGFRRVIPECGRTTPTTKQTTPTTEKSTTTTTKPKTSGSTGSSTPTSDGPGTKGTGDGGGTTSVPPGALAFTGAGVGMWILATLGGLLILAGSLLLGYARRYPRRA